ncbi:MAG TPA: methyltransferase domain-containing protein [Pyrinomonadaceae bacterium]|nr:methyltransferase domain-containing protein [Pyrinomonadaceae bacterium]
MKSYLNLGCGTRFHPAWTNLDFEAAAPGVLAHDLRRGIPFPADTFEFAYHSHVLEHFPREGARRLLAECRRVLRPGGVVRVVVPDLEDLAAAYLETLGRAAAGEAGWGDNYEYVMLELYDQTVRERPGGEMGAYLRQRDLPNRSFVLDRGGVDALGIIEAARRNGGGGERQAGGGPEERRPLAALPRRALGRLRRAGFGREALLRLILGEDYEALRVGRFRRRGEPHLWMYDRYSLPKLLTEVGFESPRLFGPAESRVPNWAAFGLDTEPDGTVYKPHSLYVEAVK